MGGEMSTKGIGKGWRMILIAIWWFNLCDLSVELKFLTHQWNIELIDVINEMKTWIYMSNNIPTWYLMRTTNIKTFWYPWAWEKNISRSLYRCPKWCCSFPFYGRNLLIKLHANSQGPFVAVRIVIFSVQLIESNNKHHFYSPSNHEP